MKLVAVGAAAAAALFCGSVCAGDGVWTTEGPYGGQVYSLMVNPSSPNVLYSSTAGGIFRSNDGGVSWARKEAGLTGVVGFALAMGMDGDAPNTLWLADSYGHFNRSSDGGDNWAQTGYSLSANDAINHVADVPGNTGAFYIATNLSGVLYSNDNGASFSPRNTGLPSGVAIGYIAVDPDNPLHLIAGVAYQDAIDPSHPQTLYLSTDGGVNWSGSLDLGYYGQTIDISFGAGSKVYAVIDSGLFRSDDDGASWNGFLPAAYYIGAVQADPDDGNTVLIGDRSGLLRSTDGGNTATALNNGLAVAAGMPAMTSRIVLHPNYPATPQIWLGTTAAGVYFSADDAATWTARSEGLSATQIRAVAMFHDGSTHRLFAGYGDAFDPSPALYRGNNAGPGTPFSSWAPSNTNLGAYQIRSITIDPTTKSGGIGSTRIYATGRSGIVNGTDVRNGGIYRSLDGGNTWTTIDSGLPASGSPPAANVGTVRALVLDPRSCASPPPSGPCTSGPLQTLYATSNGRGVGGTIQFRIMKSTNGGDSWTSSDSGIPQPIDPGEADAQTPLVVPIVIDPANPQTLYVGTNLTYDPAVVAVPSIQNGVFKSSNGGATWTFSSNGLPRHAGSVDTALDVLSLVINPANPSELWCSVIDFTNSSSGGIYHSTDGGASWSDSSSGLTSVDIRALAIDTANPAILYAAGGGTDGNPGGVFKTIDSGAHWTSISVGLPAYAATALEIDPVEPTVLYAGTSSGVWSITQMPDADADGVPDAVEQAAPNGGDGNSDGNPDYLQGKVGSLPSASAGPASGGPGIQSISASTYFTVAITPVNGTCAQAVDVQSVYAAYHGNDVSSYGDNFSYPRQLARFEVLDCQKAAVTLKFHNANFGSGFRMRFYGPSTPGDPATMGWYDFSSRATQTAPDTWQLTLDNGQFGSYRPATANGILFEGGPAYEEGIFRDGFGK